MPTSSSKEPDVGTFLYNTWSPRTGTADISGSICCSIKEQRQSLISWTKSQGYSAFHFHEYCRRKGIVHETSSPYNPRSNGHGEAAVKAAKYLLLKMKPADFPSALAAWRNTAKENKPSPNEIMFCRKVRDEKAIHASQLHIKVPGKVDQQIPPSVEQHPGLDATQETRASNTPTKSSSHSKNAHHQQIPEEFKQGDRVCVQDPCTKRWDVTALITSFSKTGRTLELYTEEGHFMRRNRRLVRRQCAA